MALLSGNEGSPIFTITGKIAALGAFGSFMKDVSKQSLSFTLFFTVLYGTYYTLILGQ